MRLHSQIARRLQREDGGPTGQWGRPCTHTILDVYFPVKKFFVVKRRSSYTVTLEVVWYTCHSTETS